MAQAAWGLTGLAFRLILLSGLLAFASAATAACPGCCSSHGGISSSCAANGKILCKDGTTSPSCTCSSCGVSGGPTSPSCSLAASPSSILLGASSRLTASCSPTPSSYRWLNANISPSASSGTVTPTATTTYSVSGTNAGGTGNTASATVTVTSPPPPTCTGGMIWNGAACTCPAGQFFVDGQCYTPAPPTACGVERWAVKTGTDSTASKVAVDTAIPSAVSTLRSITAPLSLPAASRLAPVETSVYVVDATLSLYRMTDDSDYHVVLVDNAGQTMIVELPHPDCVGVSSPFRAAIASARATFDAQLRATSSFKQASIRVRVHGIGFFDSIHGQTGVAPNGIELHPVLKITFNPGGEQSGDSTFPLATNSDRLFKWAEALYPAWFPGPGLPGIFEQYTYRFYPRTGNYAATAGGRVVVHNGRDWNFLDAGALADFMPGVAGAGF